MLRCVSLATVGALILVLTGCAAGETAASPTPSTSASPPPSTASPSPSPSTPSAMDLECNVVRGAYAAWSSSDLPESVADVRNADDSDFAELMDSGGDFLDAVRGYPDQPSKKLAVAVAEYNYELSFANLQRTVRNKIDQDQAQKVVTSAKKVHESYEIFLKDSCS